jgi:hypothetical protein
LRRAGDEFDDRVGRSRPGTGARVKALAAQLSKALDELKVFIPPPIQSIIAKLAVCQRGPCTTAPSFHSCPTQSVRRV